MTSEEPGRARLASHFDEGDWHVKWGFDSGDCFNVFPLLPKLPQESEEARWSRSFVPLRDADELLCIESEVVEALLRRVLEAHFDASLAPNDAESVPWRSPRFDWYFDNAYSPDACRELCALIRKAARKIAALPGDALVYLTEMGDVASCSSAAGDERCWHPLPVSRAYEDCELIAELLGRVVASAERQGALVTFSGP